MLVLMRAAYARMERERVDSQRLQLIGHAKVAIDWPLKTDMSLRTNMRSLHAHMENEVTTCTHGKSGVGLSNTWKEKEYKSDKTEEQLFH